MKRCPYCKIDVGGKMAKCPVCQSKLVGEGEKHYFPKQNNLKLTSFFYKIQMFIVLTLMISALGLDFLFHLKPFSQFDFHWSLIVTMWLLVSEFGILRIFRRGYGSSRILTLNIFIVLIMVLVTGFYFNFFKLAADWICPIAVMAALVANFTLAMIDKSGNTMIYLLSNLGVGIMPYIVFYFTGKDCPLLWMVCLMVSVILLVGAFVFKGRAVVAEIQRRFSV
ncbi:MAG: hypothetical protein K5773_07205 [Pseudobutyrivibrio sp.]|nr:hypothetical protein [Pseudobutyrivibrio sp.]